MQDNEKQPAENSSSKPISERLTDQKWFDILFKKFFFVNAREDVSSDVVNVLTAVIESALTDSGVDCLHPNLAQTAFSIMLDNLSQAQKTVLHHGLVYGLSHGVDQEIFDEMDKKPFFDLAGFDGQKDEVSTESTINLPAIKMLVDCFSEETIQNFEFENSEIRLAVNKRANQKTENSPEFGSLAEALSFVLNHEDLPFKLGEVIHDGLSLTGKIDLNTPEMVKKRLTAYIEEGKRLEEKRCSADL